MMKTRAGGMSPARWWWLPLALFLGAAAGLSYSLVKEPVYSADAYLVVVAQDNNNLDKTVNFAQAFSRIVTQPGILDTGKSTFLASSDLLRKTVQASASPDAPLVRVSAIAPNGPVAAERANLVADALISYANTRSADTKMRLSSFAKAFAPTSASSPIPLINAGVGAAIAILIAALAYVTPPVIRRKAPPASEPAPVRQEVGV